MQLGKRSAQLWDCASIPHFWRASGQYKPSSGFHRPENKTPAPLHGMWAIIWISSKLSLLSSNTSLLFQDAGGSLEYDTLILVEEPAQGTIFFLDLLNCLLFTQIYSNGITSEKTFLTTPATYIIISQSHQQILPYHDYNLFFYISHCLEIN